MTDVIANPPSAAELGEGKNRSGTTFAGGNAPPPPASLQTGRVDASSYFYRQQDPSAKWQIIHGLGTNPAITVQHSGGIDVGVTIEYTTLNELDVQFTEPVAGFAWLNTSEF